MAEESPPESIEFHYIKSNSFRVVHADGVWGGLTPRGYISMSFFSERNPIPRRITYDVTPEDMLGQETGRDSRSGFIREVEVEVMVDLDMAKSLIRWLEDKIGILEGLPGAEGKSN